MSKGRKLGREDRVLWGKVSRTVRPMPGRYHDSEEDFADLVEDEIETNGKPVFPTMLSVPVTADEAPVRKPGAGVHHPLEKPVKKKISRGRLPLEGRVDLHGMIQSEAHSVLRDFLKHAHERGMRHVLVITGKGNSCGSDGALKRAVPMWFARPDFRYLISSWEDAARNHGGDGALYVRLARHRNDRSGDRE